MRRNKYDIKVYTRYYMRLVILFSILFIGILWGTVSLYCIEKKPIGVSIIVSFFFMIFFGGQQLAADPFTDIRIIILNGSCKDAVL